MQLFSMWSCEEERSQSNHGPSNRSSCTQAEMSPGEEQKRAKSAAKSCSGSSSTGPSNCSDSENDSSGSHSSGGGSTKSQSNDGGTTRSTSTSATTKIKQRSSAGGNRQNPFSGSVRLVPRQRFGFNYPVVVTLDTLKSRFHMHLPDAAKSMGISETALKQVCRKLGLARWPRRLQKRNYPESKSGSTQAEAGQPASSEASFRFTSSSLPWQPQLSHQLLATQLQMAAGRQDFPGVAGQSVSWPSTPTCTQIPSLSREGFGGAARTAQRVHTGVTGTLFSSFSTVASPHPNAACAHVDEFAAAGAGPSLERGRTTTLSSGPTTACASRANSSMNAPALNAQVHTREQAKGASQGECDYHLDLQALEEHTAFAPLSALLAG